MTLPKLVLATLLVLVQLLLVALPGTAQVPPLTPNPWQERRVLNIAHRGGADELPENTLHAFTESLALGVDMLETDVYRTSDGEIVVSHDATVDRTTDGTGAIADLTLAEIKVLDAAHWYVPGRGTPHDAAPGDYVFRGVATGAVAPPEGYTAEDFRIPTLREVLERFPDVPLNIELKNGPPTGTSMAQAVADLLAEHGRTDDVVVASFLDQVLLEFKAAAPDVDTAPATAEVATFWATSQGSGIGRPLPQHRVFQVPMEFSGLEVVNEDFVRDAHRLGMAVHVWTVDDRPTMEYLVSIGVDGIMTDRPSLLEDVLTDRGVAPHQQGTAAPRPSGHLGEAASDVPLRVMTYNVRFASKRDTHEDWAARRGDMAVLLANNDIDILGTQELVAERDGYTQAADINAMLPGFTFIGRSRSTNPNDEQMGVYYRESRLEALAHGHFWLSPTPSQEGSFGYGNQGNARMVTWVQFLDEVNGTSFYLLNTHFDHASEPARYRAADQLAGYFEGDASYSGDGLAFDPGLPVVVTGDFNFPRLDDDTWFPAEAGQPTVDPIKPLRPVGGTPGVNQAGAYAPVVGNQSAYNRLVTEGPFVDTWQVAESTGEPVSGTFNGFAELGTAWIDWILARGNVRVLHSYVDTYRPGGNWPSDHIPVIADVVVG